MHTHPSFVIPIGSDAAVPCGVVTVVRIIYVTLIIIQIVLVLLKRMRMSSVHACCHKFSVSC